MPKFRKKPVVIEAEQFFADREPWPEGIKCGTREMSGADPEHIHLIETLEGPLIVSEGDWIITGVNGERYPCKPDIFQKTYEPVD